MKDISKITVKHFLNLSLPTKSDIVGSYINGKLINEPTSYPLYVKITFQRKTTQIKSTIDKSFQNIEEAYRKHENEIKNEALLIESMISKSFKEKGESFTLAGIHKICKDYRTITMADVINDYVLNDFDTIIDSTGYEYAAIFQVRLNIPSIEYYKLALLHFGKLPNLLQLQSKFELLDTFETLAKKHKFSITSIKLVDWKYGNSKHILFELTKRNKISQKVTNHFFEIIDTYIQKRNI